MSYSDQFKKVSVIGSAGKMGSGILLLLATKMADLQLENKNLYLELNAIDISHRALRGLKSYIQAQTVKIAEKKIVYLRKLYSENNDLIDNSEIIERYVLDVLANINFSINLSDSFNSTIVFEAINENPQLKIEILSNIKDNSVNDNWFFTNTSSVPIDYIDKGAGLNGKIIGFHFYNPPAVQKLLEIIKNDNTNEELADFALDLAQDLRKKVVYSADVAGFIGNGHFMRDALFGLNMATKISSDLGLPAAIYAVNKITQDFLVRPMGIFQLMDYVGIDVMKFILSVMDPYFENEILYHKIIDDLVKQKVLGGQHADGSQKEGFFRYNKGKIVSVMNPENFEYSDVADIDKKVSEYLGNLPETFVPWKVAIKDKNRDEKLKTHFENLWSLNTNGSKYSHEYLNNSKAIGILLVDSGVAFSEKDVNTVLQTGFFHAYGPFNNFAGE